jgi:peptidoglycan/xylan/chitin deacetylase (PgdA/CDA1 family)
MHMLTVIMYHYVRDIKESNYPNIKGLEYEKFKFQLNYLQSNYNIIKIEDVVAAVLDGDPIPENSCLLTFDDGYKDHIDFVVPELNARRLQGTFFPPAKAILERQLLGVNAIHFILERCKDLKALIKLLFGLCLDMGIPIELLEQWKIAYNKTGRFDSGEVVFIKMLLQNLLPEKIRDEIISILFKMYVSQDLRGFADDLYLTVRDLRMMLADEMYIGGHGYNHVWLGRISLNEQKEEIKKTVNFINEICGSTKNWVMCFPYGSYNDSTVKLLGEYKCGIAFKDNGGETVLDVDHRYILSRFDTNDFPQAI